MTDNQRGGIALIIGALSGVVTMILHPVGAGGGGDGAHVVTHAQFEALVGLMVGVHALAIAGIPFLFLGALALSRQLEMGGRLALLAFVIYCLGLVAIMIAPAISGLVGPQVLRNAAGHGLADEQWRLLMVYNHLINQAFAQIYVVASSAAIGLWSFLMVRGRARSIALGAYGLIMAPVTVIAMASGALSLDAHGFGLIVFGQAIWLVTTGVSLLRATAGPATAETNTARVSQYA